MPSLRVAEMTQFPEWEQKQTFLERTTQPSGNFFPIMPVPLMAGFHATRKFLSKDSGRTPPKLKSGHLISFRLFGQVSAFTSSPRFTRAEGFFDIFAAGLGLLLGIATPWRYGILGLILR